MFRLLIIIEFFTGIEKTLRNHRASWHKSCYNKCNTLKLQRAQKRKSQEEFLTEDPTVLGSPAKTRRKTFSELASKSSNALSCFFCDGTEGDLHKAETMSITNNVQSAAETLQDYKLIAKLAQGDMHARDAYYHKSCLTSLYNRQRSKLKQPQDSTVGDENEITPEAIALAELSLYISESLAAGEAVFKMSQLSELYSSRLEQLGVEVKGRVNSTRLKERLLTQMPELHAFKDGKDVKLAMPTDIGTAMAFVHNSNLDTAALYLAKAASIVRKEMFLKREPFEGTFTPDCQQHAVPDSLLALINMILEGPSINNQKKQEVSGASAALTISQLLIFNSVKHARSGATSNAIRHNMSRETPLTTYTALVVHAETRKKTLVDKFYKLGLCISYDRLMQISADLGNKCCKLYEKEGVVCPPKLRKNIFTTGNVDNIDHNPSSRTAKNSFHGTAISLTQHPSLDSQGQEREHVPHDNTPIKSKVVNSLPEFYTTVTPVTDEGKKDLFCPKVTGSFKPKEDLISKSIKEEEKWLKRVDELLLKEKLEEKDYLSWSAYFASEQSRVLRPNAITSLLPLFEDNAHTMAMIKHAMTTVKESTKFLNPNQTPVIAMDQPLYALAKQIQWNNKNEFGEDKYMVMMGGLHIEMAILKMIGHWLTNSGWARYVCRCFSNLRLKKWLFL